jgi:hypothetical protein
MAREKSCAPVASYEQLNEAEIAVREATRQHDAPSVYDA